MNNINVINNNGNSKNLAALEALEFINKLILDRTGKSLDNTETDIFLKIWQNNSIKYKVIAEEIGLTEHGIKKASTRLYRTLNEVITTPIRIEKKNLRSVLTQIMLAERNIISEGELKTEIMPIISPNAYLEDNEKIIEFHTGIKLEAPDRPVPLNSQFYITRKQESLAYRTIEEPGAVIRIIGSRQSGATSLVNRITHHAESNGDRLVLINFQGVEDEPFNLIKSFMKWFCVEVSTQLGLKELFKEYLNNEWSDSRVNACSEEYFEKYLLINLSTCLVIVFERIDYLFDKTYKNTRRLETAKVFFALIRTWIDRASKFNIWEKVKYVIVQSESKIEMGTKCSPFNVGEEIYLDNFSPPEIIELAKRHKLNWSDTEIKQLTEIFGDSIGNPYFIRHILYRIARENLTFKEFTKLDFKTIKTFEKYLNN